MQLNSVQLDDGTWFENRLERRPIGHYYIYDSIY